jgi:transcriptional regulator with XRE-family HTH domain
MQLREKLKLIRNTHGIKQLEFAESIDIPRRTYQKYESGEVEVSIKAFLNTLEKYPEYALWLSISNVEPEVGQIAPGNNTPKMGKDGVPAELLNAAFEQTLTTSIELGWITPKEGVNFSMLSDLLRHDFVQQGGRLIEQAEDDEVKTTAV